LIQERNRQRGRKIGIILSGGNIDFDLFRRWLMGRTKIAAESFAL
jgi:threonine dehydratase